MKATSLRISMQTLSPCATPSDLRPEAIRSARSATSSWLRLRWPLMMPWKGEDIVAFRSGVGLLRHSRAMRSIEPGISRFRVLASRAPERQWKLPRLRESWRALLDVGADGFGLVGTADQLL